MSDQTEKNLSPEERLLKVIQGKSPAVDNKASAVAKVTPTIARTESDAAPTKTPPRLRPRPLTPRTATPVSEPKPTPPPPPAITPAALPPEDEEETIVIAAAPSVDEPVVFADAANTSDATEEAVAVAPVPVFGAAPAADAPLIFSDQGTTPPIDADDESGAESPEKESRTFGISIINTCLAALLTFAVIVILASEIISQFSKKDADLSAGLVGALPPAQDMQRAGALPDLTELLAAFNARGFLVQRSEETTEAPAPQAEPSGNSLKKYVREHIVILGLSWTGDRSVQEAILMDQSGPRMHIVKPGDEISLSGGTLKIERIAEDAVIGHDGLEEIVIGKKKP